MRLSALMRAWLRFPLALVLLAACVEVADAGPLLDLVRERREARQNGGGLIFPRLTGNAGVSSGYGGCANGQCPQSYQQSGGVYYVLPAGGCANGQCPIPTKK